MVYTQVVYITYNMGNRDLPDIYAHALGPAALGLGHIYQANPSCPCYNLYIYYHIILIMHAINKVFVLSKSSQQLIKLK